MRARRILRTLLVLLVVLLIVPFLVPLPPVGVEAATLADADGQFIEVDGLSTYVLARGPEDGQAVLLLHGWGASTFTWREQMDVLAAAGYRAIAFDRPPYGLSQKTGDSIPYSLTALADFTAHVMDKLGIERAVLVGQSQGGGVAGYFAVNYPERVDKLVLVSAALRASNDSPPPSDGERPDRVGGALGMPPLVSGALNLRPVEWWVRVLTRVFVKPSFVTSILKSAYYNPEFMTPEVSDGYAKQLQVIGWDEALINQLRRRDNTDDAITAEQIAAIDVPVMIAWGENDTWVDISAGERLRELLLDAEWHTYPNTGHLPQEEAAAAFNADLLAFLAAE